MVKKTEIKSTNENKNQANSGYASSGGGGPLITGKLQPLKPIKEEGTKTPNIFTQQAKPPRASSRPAGPSQQQSAAKANPLNSSFEGMTVLANGRMRDISTDAARATKAPATLNPVQPPMKRQDLNASVDAALDYAGGYASPGQESESTKISNLKYAKGVKAAVTNRDSVASTSLSKISKV